MPLAEETRLPEWERIDAAFADNQDPLFGNVPRAGFEDLYTTITTMVPAPYGVGREWR